MARKAKKVEALSVTRPKRVKLSEQEIIKHMKEFPKRRAKFIAAIRKGKGRGVSA